MDTEREKEEKTEEEDIHQTRRDQSETRTKLVREGKKKDQRETREERKRFTNR